MLMLKATRLFHTVRYLKPRQIVWRLYYRLMTKSVQHRAMAPLGTIQPRQWQSVWIAPAWMAPCLIAENEFRFLDATGSIATAEDWNHLGKSKLWLYNLHYFDDLNAKQANERFADHRQLVERWIDENPPLEGNGWEPYTLSLRLVNLIKWLASDGWQKGSGFIPAAWVKSLARQAQTLSAQREYHILANHLFANGKALTFAGAFLAGDDGERWLKQGLEILDQEIPEQFLDDGGHFERSPMYHATLMWDLCDLIRLAECSDLAPLRVREPEWRKTLANGLDWLDMMTHPDGEIGFFNDAALGIAPSLAYLRYYADKLDVASPSRQDSLLSQTDLNVPFEVSSARQSGYVSMTWAPGGKALLDIAPIGPDYQPGHAHADTLSFELSLFGERVLVNSGISQYGEDAERQRQRSSAAHNTVVVDGHDSSEVWAGFRVARRARPSAMLITANDGQLSISGSHDGYRRLPGKIVHRREWNFKSGSLTVRDSLKGVFSHAEARFHCHPSVTAELHDAKAGTLMLADGKQVSFIIEGGRCRLESTTWHLRFGQSHPNQCLAITFEQPHSSTTFSWT